MAGLSCGPRAAGWSVPPRGGVFGLQHGHQDEVLPAVWVEPGLAADTFLAESAGQIAADGAAVAGQHLQLDAVQAQHGESPGQDQPGYLLTESLAAQAGHEQAHRVGRAVLISVDAQPGAANAL